MFSNGACVEICLERVGMPCPGLWRKGPRQAYRSDAKVPQFGGIDGMFVVVISSGLHHMEGVMMLEFEPQRRLLPLARTRSLS